MPRINRRTNKDLVYYRRGVYVPGYEPNYWTKWLLLATSVVALLLFFNWLYSRDENNGLSNVPNTSNSIIKSENKVLEGPYKVARVVDGDTVDVIIDGKTERIRLIGMDTPETVDPNLPVQCYGPEADRKARGILTGKSVYIEVDKSQSDKDRYNRLLRHIYLEDKTNFSEIMIREGYAVEYTFGNPHKYQANYKSAEKDAKENYRGLWSTSTCNGKISLHVYKIIIV